MPLRAPRQPLPPSPRPEPSTPHPHPSPRESHTPALGMGAPPPPSQRKSHPPPGDRDPPQPPSVLDTKGTSREEWVKNQAHLTNKTRVFKKKLNREPFLPRSQTSSKRGKQTAACHPPPFSSSPGLCPLAPSQELRLVPSGQKPTISRILTTPIPKPCSKPSPLSGQESPSPRRPWPPPPPQRPANPVPTIPCLKPGRGATGAPCLQGDSG